MGESSPFSSAPGAEENVSGTQGAVGPSWEQILTDRRGPSSGECAPCSWMPFLCCSASGLKGQPENPPNHAAINWRPTNKAGNVKGCGIFKKYIIA